MFERVSRLTIDDMISIMENHNVTDKPVKLLSTGYSEHEILRVVLDTLKAYRDSGLSPEQVRELAQAKAEGRLVVLPVKVGDTVETKRGKGEVVAWDTTARVKIYDEPDFNRRYKDYDIDSKIFTREAEKAIGGGKDE